MARRMLVAGNWKMNLGYDESRMLAAAVAEGAPRASGVELAVFPQVAWLLAVRDAVGQADVGVGAQNGHPAASGALTGEISIATLAPFCRYILAGHSERRHIFNETDAFVGEKVAAIRASGSLPILCVGETLDERRAGSAEAVVVRQLAKGLHDVAPEQVAGMTVAYEPVWAIGTGVAATPEDAQAMCAEVRRWIDETHGKDAATRARVLYGGSVTPDNAAALFTHDDIDGALVGGASLKADSFLAIAAAAVR